MTHKVFRLLNSLYNVPHLIDANSAETILSYLESRNIKFEEHEDSDEPYGNGVELVNPQVGIVNVHGALTYKPYKGACGEVVGCSYKGILEQTRELAESGVKIIVFDMASCGGEASHAFTTANEIKEICNEYKINLIAYVDEMALSAGYLLACIADEVIMHPSASAGNIGCIVCLKNDSQACERAGIKRIFIASPEGKNPFEESGEFKKEFLDEIDRSVRKLNSEFVNFVFENTGIFPDELNAMNAKKFDAIDAVRLGLANNIMDHNQFADYISIKIKQQNIMEAFTYA